MRKTVRIVLPKVDWTFFRVLAHCGRCNIAWSSIRSIVLWQKGPLIYVQFHVEHDVKHMGPFCLFVHRKEVLCIYPEAANFLPERSFKVTDQKKQQW